MFLLRCFLFNLYSGTETLQNASKSYLQLFMELVLIFNGKIKSTTRNLHFLFDTSNNKGHQWSIWKRTDDLLDQITQRFKCVTAAEFDCFACLSFHSIFILRHFISYIYWCLCMRCLMITQLMWTPTYWSVILENQFVYFCRVYPILQL